MEESADIETVRNSPRTEIGNVSTPLSTQLLCDHCRSMDVRQMLLDCKSAYESQPRSTTDSTNALNPMRSRFVANLTAHQHMVGQVYRTRYQQKCDLCQVFCSFWRANGIYCSMDEFQLYMGIAVSHTAFNPLLRHGPAGTGRGCHSSSMELYADRDSLPAEDHALIGYSINENPSSRECVSMIHEWRDNCAANHQKCRSSRDHAPSLPTRVVDVSPDSGHDRPRIIATNGQSGNWAALSYCWGGSNDFGLTTESKAALEQGLDLKDWPATLRDAILITRQQNVRYLWIDALCIMQDSPEDWENESARMYEVYRRSLFTIVAANSSHVNHGILHRREMPKPLVKINWKHPDGKSRSINLRYPFIGGTSENELLNSQIFTRAWTMQEALLSRRLLIYTEKQVIWSCETCEVDEKGRVYEPITSTHFPFDYQQSQADVPASDSVLAQLLHHEGQDPAEGSMSMWTYWQICILHEYGRRRCAFQKDTLPAISGIAKAFHDLTGDEYLAGLWKKDLVSMLTWTRWPIGRPSYTHVAFSMLSVDVAESWKQRSKRLESEKSEAYEYSTTGKLRRSHSVGSGLTLYRRSATLRKLDYANVLRERPHELEDNGCGYSSPDRRILRQWIPSLEAKDCLVNDISRPSIYLAPSWSWASVNGDRIIHYCFSGLFTVVKSCSIESVTVVPSSTDPFGAVRDGRLTLRAPMRRVPHSNDGQLDHINFDPVAKPLRYLIHPVEDENYGRPGWTDLYEFVQQHRPCEDQQFFLVHLLHCRIKHNDEGSSFMERANKIDKKQIFMLVESTPEPGLYRRIGLREAVLRRSGNLFQTGDKEAHKAFNSVDGWKEKTITII